MIAISYARTSGESGDSVSLASQHKRNRKYAEYCGATILCELSDEASGTTYTRPELNKAVQLIIAGKANMFIVFAADRLARKVSVAEYLLEEIFMRHGVSLHISSTGREVKYTPEDLLMFNVENSFAAYERNKIVERTNRGKSELLEQGIWVGEGKTNKFGFKKVGNKRNTQIEAVAEEIAVINLIKDLFLYENIGVQRICKELTARNVPTPSQSKGVTWNIRTTWQKQMVYRILRDETYTGKWGAKRYKRVPNGNGGFKHVLLPKEEWVYISLPHTRVFTDDEFIAIGEKLDEGRSKNAPTAQHEYLLARRCKCGECGYGMLSKTQGAWKGTKYSYYRCCGREEKRSDCTMPTFSTNKVDAKIWEVLEAFLKDPAYRRECLETAQAEQIANNQEAIIMLEAVNKRKAQYEAELYRLTELYTEGHISKDVFLRKKKELEEKHGAVQDVEKEYTATLQSDFLSDADIHDIDADMSKIADWLDTAEDKPFAVKRRLIEAMGVTVHFHREQLDDGQMWYTAHVFVYGSFSGSLPLWEVSQSSYCLKHYPIKAVLLVRIPLYIML